MNPVTRPPIRTAEVIAVGSELLGSTRVDTNSLYVTERLASIGIEVRSKAVVGDDRSRIADLVRQALIRSDLVVLTGGLGPTDDDLTREAVSDVVRAGLVEDPAIVARIAERFARRHMRMPDVNRRQALVLEGAVVVENPGGTAPGQYVEHGERVIVMLPGPPRELRPMLDGLCEGPLAVRAAPDRVYRTSLFIAGRGESHVEEVVQPIYAAWRDETPPIETTILATPGQTELHLSIRCGSARSAQDRLSRARDELAAVLGDDLFSTDGRSMEETLGGLLRSRGLRIAAAESCSGGLLLSRLTDVPGSSEYVVGGAVLYSNDLKVSMAGVAEAALAEYGAVSEPVAVMLAEGIRDRTGADVAVGITGIAGPGGGTPQKPVGTVCIAAIVPGTAARVRTFRFPGGRTQVKFFAAQSAMDMVRRALLFP